MGCNKRIRRKLRKMQGGGDIVSSLPQMMSYANMGGSMVGDQVFSLTDTTSDPNSSGIVDPNAAAFQTGISNVGYGPFSMIMAYNAYNEAEKNNEKVQRQLNVDAGWNQLAKKGMMPNQASYTQMMPNGGNVGSETVELEKGEPFKLPDGTIESIPVSAPSHKQGGVPITLPHGTKVLGKKKAWNGKEFKEMGRKLKDAQKQHQNALDDNPTSLRARTAKRMLSNINKQYGRLFDEQGVDVGSPMMSRGGVVTMPGSENPRYLSGKPQVDDNGDVNYFSMNPYQLQDKSGNYYYPLNDTEVVRGLVQSNPDKYFKVDNGYGTTESYNHTNPLYKSSYKRLSRTNYLDSNIEDKVSFSKGGRVGLRKGGGGLGVYLNEPTNPATYTEYINPIDQYMSLNQEYIPPYAYGIPASDTIPSTSSVTPPPRSASISTPINNDKIPWWVSKGETTFPLSSTTMRTRTLSNDSLTESLPINPYPGIGRVTPDKGALVNTTDNNIDYANTMNTMGAFAPVMYNLYQGMKPADKVTENQFANPYEARARSLMNRRKYNVQPELERNALATATYNRGLMESGASPSQMRGGRLAGLVGQRRADAETLARAQNVNAQYMTDQAGFEMNAGRDVVQRRAMVRDLNEREEAARRNYTSAGLSQLGQYSQMNQLQSNQQVRDMQRLGLLKSFAPGFSLNVQTGEIIHDESGKIFTPAEYNAYIKG